MKKEYLSPVAELVVFKTEDILSDSGDNPILDQNQENTPGTPAKDFGEIDIF